MKIRKIRLMLCLFILAGCSFHQERQPSRSNAETEQTILTEEQTKENLNNIRNTETEIETEIQTEEEFQTQEEIQTESCLKQMTLEEKAAQLFIVAPESLVGESGVTAAGEKTKEAFAAYPVGGLIYFTQNLVSGDQMRTMLSNMQTYSMERTGLPVFTCIDEEGGAVARIGGTGKFDVPEVERMADIGAAKDVQTAYEAGSKIGNYLYELGFNVDFAPVADVWSNPENEVVKERSFGSDPELVSDMALAVYQGLDGQGVCGAFKHFPGHGATEADTHDGYAYTGKTLDELMGCELIPFQEGILHEVPFIMVGHISVPNVTGDDTPASLSKTMITDILRTQMEYGGIVVTDAMNMGAVAKNYSSSEASVKALEAGVDMILMPADFKEAYAGVLDAVRQGVLSEERIEKSVRRIINLKLRLHQNGR